MGILASQWKPSCLEISELGTKAKQNKNKEREQTEREIDGKDRECRETPTHGGSIDF